LRDNYAHIFKAVTSLAGRAKKSQGPDDIDEEVED
jgi:hypothetical protein